MCPTIGATPAPAPDPHCRIPADVSAHPHRPSAGRQARNCHNGRWRSVPASYGGPWVAGWRSAPTPRVTPATARTRLPPEIPALPHLLVRGWREQVRNLRCAEGVAVGL